MKSFSNKIRWAVRGLLTVFFLLPGLSLAAVWYIDGDVTDSGDGTSWEEAFQTIQEGVDASSGYDEVWVKPSVRNNHC